MMVTKDQVKQALRDSIAHWDRHATGTAGTREGTTGDSCALCDLERHAGGDYQCPVAKAVGSGESCNNCEHSPWYDAYKLFNSYNQYSGNLQTEEFKLAAAKERDFLQSLLDKEEQE